MFTRSLACLLLLGVLSLAAEDVQGLVQPFKSVLVASPVLQEVIDAMKVEEGDNVEEGQVLAELRHSTEVLAVEEAEQIVQQADFVATGFTNLFNQKMGSKEQMLKSQTELKLAKIRLDATKVRLNEKTVKAPLAGIVIKKFKESGESVDRAEKMVEIVNIDQLYAQFYLDPKFINVLQKDDAVTVRFPEMKEHSMAGKISFIAPQIDASSGLFRVKVLFENPNHKVKAGMKAIADFTKRGEKLSTR
jgi:RND family efflux transporter MFP subunit